MDRASQTLWGTVIFFTIVGAYFYLSHPEHDGGPTRWARWKVRFFAARNPIMSSVRKVRTTSTTSTQVGSTSSPHVETPDTYQAEPSALAKIEAEPNLHNYSRSGLIAILSVQKTETGAYRWTANQIAAFVGGTRSEVLKEIALYRPSLPVPAHQKRPANGWQA